MAERRATIFLLLGMMAWIVAGMIGAVVVALMLGLSAMLLRRMTGTGFEPAQYVYILIAASAFQGILLWGALRQGRSAGGGDQDAGLGIRRLRHGARVALLCGVMIIWLMAFVLLASAIPALREFARSVTPDVLSGLGAGGPFVVLLRVVLVLALAPVSEELFFRGWLWEALRQRGHTTVSIAGLTALPWLLLHGIDSPGRILFLIPAAVVFSVARQQGGGVLGSLATHLTNNLTAVSMQAIAAAFGQG